MKAEIRFLLVVLVLFAIVPGILYFTVLTTGPSQAEFIFPNKFTGPVKISLDPSAPDLRRNGGQMVIEVPVNGSVGANQDDFERLERWMHGVYRYENGSPITLYVPHNGQPTKGPWVEWMPREGIVEGQPPKPEVLEMRVGTVTRD